MEEIELTKQLVGIRSFVDDTQDEALIADFLVSYLQKSLPWLTVTKQPVSKTRYNIIAVNNSKPRFLFISHMDTVLPSGNMKDKLTPQIKLGRLYGLGSCDMKAGLAASIIALKRAGPGSNTGLIFDCDEEYYFLGARKLIEKYRFSPDLVVFPEPTDMKILSGCRGLLEIACTLIGKTCHAGRPEKGINAIEQSVQLVNQLKISLTAKDTDTLGKTTVNLSAMRAGIRQNQTIAVQANAVPDIARFLLDIRTADLSMSGKTVSGKIKDMSAMLGLQPESIQVNLDYQPFLSGKKQILPLQKAIKKSGWKVAYMNLSETGFFEASFISKAWGCAAVAFGPGYTAHEENEFVPVKDISKTTDIFTALITG